MNNSENKLFLIDAYALIFRAYYAFIKNPRINSKGLNTSAIFGFTNALDEILKKEKPSHIAVAFDHKEGSFRKILYPEYKANRSATPEDIIKSVPYIKQIIKAFNIPILEIENYEADDTIGTIAKLAEKEGFTVYMMTPDKDFKQLVSDKIFMYKHTRSGKPVEIVDAKSVLEQYKIKKTEQFIDILALWGDSADNIPGVPGIGEKKAADLVSKFGSVENILMSVNLIKGKQKENIIASRESIKLSKELATIALDVPVKFNADEFKLKKFNADELTKIFEELEFKNTAIRILENPQTEYIGKSIDTSTETTEITIENTNFTNIKTVAHNYVLIENQKDIDFLISELSKQKEFCFDTETTGLEVHTSDIVGIAFSFENHKAYYLNLPKIHEEASKVINQFKSLFENNKILKIGQNIKFDILMLKPYGIEVSGPFFDTMIAHYLINPDSRHNFKVLSESLLNYQPVEIEELIGKKGKDQLNMANVPIEDIKEYAAEDADITFQLKEILEKKLDENKLSALAEKIEMPLIPVLAELEFAGINLNTENLIKFSSELNIDIDLIEKEIFKLAGSEFNISSPKQMGEILFDKMKIISNAKKTKTGQYSTSEQELLKLKDKHVIIEKILEYRGLQKLLSTYVDALPKLINAKTNKIHTSYNQAVTTTGRLSSSNPNLQNIPIRTEKGREIRKAFVASKNNILLAADYSQIELRLMASMSEDKNMIDDFLKGEDIHSATASKIFNVPLNEVDREKRAQAKSANFGIIYGISAFGLAQNLAIKRSLAKEIIDEYFKNYPKIKDFMDSQIEFARQNEFVTTLLGRKRQLPDINSRNSLVKSFAERNAVNAPIQGTAADIIKIAMINISNKLKENNLKSKMILQVHDELVFDVEKEELENIKAIVIKEMENAFKLKVPLTVDLGIGDNWLEAH
ncbi:MAG: DNA polymerase I [Bacteroidales bacterium]|nr:DNA polymerase I [Bacteroidales bacterium]MBN2758162.1 DNA polymerase I [Bacteroidales bacterium]